MTAPIVSKVQFALFPNIYYIEVFIKMNKILNPFVHFAVLELLKIKFSTGCYAKKIFIF